MVSRALDQAVAVVQVPVALPFQPHAAMRAAVLVHVHLARATNSQQRQAVDLETPALPLGQFYSVTKVVQ